MRASMEDIKALRFLLQAQLELQALSVFYMAIDRAAWLFTEKEDSNRHDFISWTDKFLIADEELNFSALDLWAARCGLLHTGAAESRDYRKNGANLIYYKAEAERSDQETLDLIAPMLDELCVTPDRVRFVDHFWLADRLDEALARFEDWLKTETEVCERAAIKADRQISFQALPPK